MRRARRFLFGGMIAALLAHAAPLAHAQQGLDTAPISIEIADVDDGLVLAAFAASDQAPVFETLQQTATPAAARPAVGLPRPSIILGWIAPGEEPEFGLENLLPSTVEQVAFPLDDLAARTALRRGDPDIFRRLVQEGHLDPAANELNRVLQTELARMNCYRSGIDGAWGPGSRRSVGEYFEELGSQDWSDPSPSNALFRAILLNGDVACPTPVAAAPAARPTPARTSTATRSQSRATAPAPRTSAPAAKPKPKLSISGSGVLR